MNQQEKKQKENVQKQEWTPNPSMNPDQEQKQSHKRKKQTRITSHIQEPAKKMRFIFGITSLVTLIIAFSISSNLSEEQGLEEIANRTSSSIESGFTITDMSEVELDARDFEVGDFDGGTARMLIWDFTGDSEDKVQIIVDGQVLRESHTLTSSVAAYSVPVPSVVTIQGLDSNATYAVKFPERRYTIFNVVTSGTGNSYTLTPGL
ncbi:hypothetical protein [Alkalicoccobacillus porphyridii]|uniref:Uncharacterized protein n=1 Tax=Alkalicoccobacillus porphyridii TaxID=2597270 RepID=A0A554A109_9BACI|nr:hypothetical protein [Alkalicoccobacillus porphyridii]TSB47378.1 hypothetical protein FN960_06470 [Alkalicoccobacillus porphyridii]